MATHQQYTYEVNRSTAGTDFVSLDVIDRKFPLSKKVQDGEIFGRFHDFSIECYDAGFELLQAIALNKQQTELKVYLNGVLQVQGVIELLGFQDDNKELSKLKVKVDDPYKLLLEGINKEFNYLDGDLDIWTLLAETNFIPLTYKLTSNFTDPAASPVGSLWGTSSDPSATAVYARQEWRVKDFVANELIGTSGWVQLTDHGDGTITIVRDWTSTSYPASSWNGNWRIYDTASGSQGRALMQQMQPDELQNPTIQIDEIVTHLFENNNAGTWEQIGILNDTYYGDTQKFYTRARKLFDIIEYLVGQIDATIAFETDGSADDSYFYFKDYTNSESQDTLAELMVTQITDFILNDAGNEKSDPATIANITLEKILNYIKKRFYVFWELENRSGTYYFVFKHWTERSFVAGYDFTDFSYYGVNWTAGKKQYETEQSKLWKYRKRSELSGNEDFVGLDLILLNVNTEDIDAVDFAVFYTDIWDIQNNPSKYPDNSTNQFNLATTERKSSGTDLLGSTNISNDSAPNDYETYAYNTGTQQMDADNTSGNGYATIDTGISLVRGDALEVDYDLTINSGSGTITFVIDAVSYTLSAGTGNKIYTKTVRNASNYQFTIRTSSVINFTLVFNSIKKYYYNVLKSTGAISGDSVLNAAISIANTDDEHLAKIPLADINVNGVDITLAANQLEKIRKIKTIMAPLIDFADFDFSENINTDLGQTEIESISLPDANKLAKFDLMF
jgi:hypothetical protein